MSEEDMDRNMDRNEERNKFSELKEFYDHNSFESVKQEGRFESTGIERQTSKRLRESMDHVSVVVRRATTVAKRRYFKYKHGVYLGLLLALIAILGSTLVIVMLGGGTDEDTSPTSSPIYPPSSPTQAFTMPPVVTVEQPETPSPATHTPSLTPPTSSHTNVPLVPSLSPSSSHSPSISNSPSSFHFPSKSDIIDTPSPTSSPSSSTSHSPTKIEDIGTLSPTLSPSQSPTKSEVTDTPSPTSSPSSSPSHIDTFSPTSSPSSSPSYPPTKSEVTGTLSPTKAFSQIMRAKTLVKKKEYSTNSPSPTVFTMWPTAVDTYTKIYPPPRPHPIIGEEEDVDIE